MANPQYLVTGTPKVESFDLQVGPAPSFPDFRSRSDHPFAPWGPVTKFYVRFAIRPVRQFCFQAPRLPENHALQAVELGVVLARAYEGRANLCIWEGQILDAILRVAGINPGLAKTISRAVHDRIVSVPKLTLTAQVDVEMDVVTPYFVQGNHALDMISESVLSQWWARGDCGACSEPLVREMVVRRAECSHFFHAECLSGLVEGGSRVCPICRFDFGSEQDDDENRAMMQRQRKQFQENCGCDSTHLIVPRRFKPDRCRCNGDGFHEQCSMLVSSDGASSSNAKPSNLPQPATNKRCRC